MSPNWGSDQELARALSSLEGPTDQVDLAASVSRRIAEAPPRLQARDRFALLPRGGRRVAVLLVLLLLGATVAAGTRLVVGAIEIQDTGAPGGATSLVPETGPNLGRSTTLADAKTRAAFEVLVPSALGDPDAVFIDEGGSRVSLAWRSDDQLPAITGTQWGALVVEFGGDKVLAVKQMAVDGGEWVDVGDVQGYWIEGPHVLQLADGTAFRVRGNVLLVQRGDTTMRLEIRLGLAEAVRIVESI